MHLAGRTMQLSSKRLSDGWGPGAYTLNGCGSNDNTLITYMYDVCYNVPKFDGPKLLDATVKDLFLFLD